MKIKTLGFTLIEMILVVAILGILAISAITIFTGGTVDSARRHSRDAAVASIQSGISVYAAEQALTGTFGYPGTLDGVGINTWASGTAPLFVTVIKDGITSQWRKISNTCYLHDTNGNATVDAPDTYFSYTSATGAFTLDADGC